MRILAIRGQNLASLAGEFAIEFERDPLARAGLFAICGPTGAGKSTLLDALCVALFDKTPRLTKQSNVFVGHEGQPTEDRLGAADVRGLLRRGAASGYAEVDFVGRDHRRYRARWEVWRARRRSDGRLQKQTMSLEDLDEGKNLSGTKTETLCEIETRLGLSFEQFRRSALLAQGEFAAFLRADERARSELLERMTGTEIYGALSRAAFERKRDEEAVHRQLLGQVDRHAVLSDPDREAVERDHELARTALAQVNAALTAAQTAVAWHQRRDELVGDENTARAALADADREWSEAEHIRTELALVRKARAYRAVIEACDRADDAAAAADAELTACKRALDDGQAAYRAAREALERAERDVQQASARHDAARPALDAAARLDTELAAGARMAEKLDHSWREISEIFAKTRDQQSQLSAVIDDCDRALDRAQAWIADNAHIEPLADEWSRWQSALERYVETIERKRALDRDRPELADRDRRAKNALDNARQAHRDARDERDTARARADKLQRAADEAPITRARRVRDAMTQRRDALKHLAQATEAAQTSQEICTRSHTGARDERARVTHAERQIEALTADLQRLDGQLEEARAVLDRMRLARDLSSHRNDLVDGEPCPLCGATEHPWGEDRSPVDRLIADQRARIDALQHDHGQLEQERASTRAAATEAQRRADEHDAHAAAAERDLDAAQAQWRARLAELGELALVTDPADDQAHDWVAARLTAAEAELLKLVVAERKAAALQDDARHAHGAVALRESDFAQAQTRVHDCETSARRAASTLGECDAEIARAVDQLSRIETELAAVCADDWSPRLSTGDRAGTRDWRAWLGDDPDAFAAQCRVAVDAWSARQRDLTERRAARATAAIELKSVRAAVIDHEARERACAQERAKCHAELDGLRRERAALFDGRSAADVREQLARDIERLDQVAREVRGAHQARAEHTASVRAKVEASEQSLARRRDDANRARAALDDALAHADMDLPTLRQRAAVTDDWIDEQQRAVDARQRARQQAHAVLDERTSKRAAHEATGAPALDRDEAAASLDAARAEQARAQARVSELHHALRMDDDARARRTEMARELANQERRCRLYATLSELIGSADGKKFRVFAQSLTLDALLGFANRHLEDLTSRYRLIRVPGYDLDLQVIDRDMGDEVRSINSLSGGESFLVSLALALGLSSLAARDTRVESLLIDEGFGSLDPSTLETALSVLDALQATGRKVGLISHVPGLAERVGVRIVVRPQGGGRSLVRVAD